jgi:hypothetical protein
VDQGALREPAPSPSALEILDVAQVFGGGWPRTGSVSAERDATTEHGLVGNRPDDAPAENRVDQQAVQVGNEWDIGRDMNVVDKVRGAMAGSGRFE